MRRLVWIEVVVFLSISLHLYVIPAQSQVTFVQVTPEEGNPICWNSKLTYNCTVRAGQLIWGYSGMDVEPRAFFSFDMPFIGDVFILGPFDVVLLSIEPTNNTFNMESTLTVRDQLTEDIDGQNISCSGTVEVVRTLSIAEPRILNADFCNSTVYWSPPPCDANCTISVDGQDVGTVPCSEHNLTAASVLNGERVVITAVDGLGRVDVVQVEASSSADCVSQEMIVSSPTVSLMHSSSDFCDKNEQYLYEIEDTSLNYVVIEMGSGEEIEFVLSKSNSQLIFDAKCGKSYEIQVNKEVITTIEAKSCRGFQTCVIVSVFCAALAVVSLAFGISVFIYMYLRWKKKVQSAKGGVVIAAYNKQSDLEVCIDDKADPTGDDKRKKLVVSQLGRGQQPIKGNNVTQAPISTNNAEKPMPPKKSTGPPGKQGFASSNTRGDCSLAAQNRHSGVSRETGGDRTTKSATVGVSKNPQSKKPDSHVSGNANTNRSTQSATEGVSKNQQPKKPDSRVSGNVNTNRLTQSATEGVSKNQQPKKPDSHVLGNANTGRLAQSATEGVNKNQQPKKSDSQSATTGIEKKTPGQMQVPRASRNANNDGVTQSATAAITRNSPGQKKGGDSSRKPEIDRLTPGATVNGSKTPPTNRGGDGSSRKAENGRLTNKPSVVHPTGSAAQDGNHTPSGTIQGHSVPEELKGGHSTDNGAKDGSHNPPAKKEEPPVVEKPQGKTSKMLVVDGKIKVYKPGTSSIVHCKISPDAAFIAIVDSDWKVSILRCDSVDEVKFLWSSSCVLSLEWLEDFGDNVLMVANHNKLKIIDVEEDKTLVDFKLESFNQGSRIICMAYCATKSVFALSCLSRVGGKESDSDDCSGLLIISDHRKGKDKMKCSVKVKSPVTCMVFNNDGTQLITGNEEGKLTMYDVQIEGNQCNAKPHYDWSTPHGTVYNVQYSYDEQYVCSIGKSEEFFLQSKLTASGSPDPTNIKINPGAVSIVVNTKEGFPICGQLFSLMERKNYVLTSSYSQGVIFKVKGGKNVEKLTLGPFDAKITCVDWKPAEDVGSVGVMGCADNSVHVMKIVYKV